jgi:predicted amidohydrolase YtcJ
MPNTRGISVNTAQKLEEYCKWAFDHGFQVAIHCIGDGANREALRIYAKFLPEGNDLRWRIEHSQIVNPADMAMFGKYSVIPSIQPTHATSDMLWADERVGERIKYAYPYKELLNQLGWLPAGTDFPIEQVNPVYTFFAAVYRMNLDFVPEEGFQMENALSKEEALRAMTIWAAKASFEEGTKGSIEKGKYADFVVLDKDIMTASGKEVPFIKVLRTFVGGEEVYKAE